MDLKKCIAISPSPIGAPGRVRAPMNNSNCWRRSIRAVTTSRVCARSSALLSVKVAGMTYIPNVAPPEVLDEPVCWFAFCGGQLLAVPTEERADLPLARSLAEFGLVTVRTQYLGTLRGRHCFSAEIASETEPPEGMGWFGLRRLFGQADDAEYALAGRAVQIMEWDRTHQFCGACGTATESRSNERVRVCPACAHAVYPRLAPAVMMLVRNGRELLLGRSPHFQPGVYSALAGF